MFYFRLTMALSFLCIILCGCAPEVSSDPHELLEQALGTFSSKHSVVELEESGTILPSSLAESWNPLSNIETFKSRVKQVQFDKKLSDAKVSVLTVSMDPEEAKNSLSEQLHAQLEDIKRETIINSEADKEGKRIEDEISARLQSAAEELEQLLNGLAVDSEVRLWIDRRSLMPTRMKVDTILTGQGGPDSKEVMTESFRIS